MEEEIKETPIDIIEHAASLADTYYQLAIVNVTEKTVNILSSGMVFLIACTAGMMILLLGGFALSWWLGDLLDSRSGGFLLGAVFFLLLLVIAMLMRKKYILPFFRNLITRKIYE